LDKWIKITQLKGCRNDGLTTLEEDKMMIERKFPTKRRLAQVKENANDCDRIWHKTFQSWKQEKF